MHVAGSLPILLLTASNRQRPAGQHSFVVASRASERGLAFMIPDVPWYASTALGWAGTDPDISLGLGHGPLEQV